MLPMTSLHTYKQNTPHVSIPTIHACTHALNAIIELFVHAFEEHNGDAVLIFMRLDLSHNAWHKRLTTTTAAYLSAAWAAALRSRILSASANVDNSC